MKSVVLAILLLLVASTSARGEDFLHRGILKGTEYYGFAGYEVGGSAPTSMPASIRGVNKLSLTPNLIAGFQMEKPLTGRIGLQLGLQFENKGMTVDSRVKNYHVAVERGGETLEGQFTGNVNVHATEWMFTVPLMATYKVGKVHLKAGPYVSYLTSCDFHGWACARATPPGPRCSWARPRPSVATLTSPTTCGAGTLAWAWGPTGTFPITWVPSSIWPTRSTASSRATLPPSRRRFTPSTASWALPTG